MVGLVPLIWLYRFLALKLAQRKSDLKVGAEVDFTMAVDLRVWEGSHEKTGGFNIENLGFSLEKMMVSTMENDLRQNVGFMDRLGLQEGMCLGSKILKAFW